MKKFLLAILVAFPMLAFAQSPKFGTVDTNTIMTSLPDLKTVQDQISQASKRYEDEFKKLQDQMNKEYSDFQALPADTPEAIKQRRQGEINDLYQKLEQFQATAQQDLQRQQQQLMEPLVTKVQAAITAVGQEQGFTFIFEQGMALYSGSDVTDITPAVKTRLGIK